MLKLLVMAQLPAKSNLLVAMGDHCDMGNVGLLVPTRKFVPPAGPFVLVKIRFVPARDSASVGNWLPFSNAPKSGAAPM